MTIVKFVTHVEGGQKPLFVKITCSKMLISKILKCNVE
jgi:hypothetical protein